MTPAIIRMRTAGPSLSARSLRPSKCRDLRTAGYDYDRRNGVWFMHDVVTAAHDAPA